MRRRRTRHARRGYVLVFFAMMGFGLFALAALVIDLGMVRLTQRQMQSATDSAALEGLRFRDGIPASLLTAPAFQELVKSQPWGSEAPTTPYNPSNSEWADWISKVNQHCDLLRRELASQLVSNVFDDDLNPNDADTSGNGSVPGNWGAGPVVNFSGGAGNDPSLAASQLMTLPPLGQRTYNPGQSQNGVVAYPALQTNLVTTSTATAQQSYGDMVSGQYAYNQAYDATYGGWTVYPWEETAKGPGGPYDRRDFTPNLAPDQKDASPDPAFLVRMRRLNPNDFQSSIDDENGVSTHGPPLPFLFGRGSMIHKSAATSYSPREDGLTVRATGIANAAPAISVGPTIAGIADGNSSISIDGLASFALHQAFWNQGFVDPANTTSPPFTAIQTEAIDATDTTLTLETMSSGSVLPPIWVPPILGSNATTANPMGLVVSIDQELMLVTRYDSETPGQLIVQRGYNNTPRVAHAAGSQPNGRFILPLQSDAWGNLIDVPAMVVTLSLPSGSSTLTPITGTGHVFAATAAAEFAVIVSNTTNATPAFATVSSTIPDATPATTGGVPTWTFNLATRTSAAIPLGICQVDVICPTAAIGQSDTQVTVTMPSGYLPDHADPGHVTGQMYLALVYDPTNPSSREYIRVRSQVTQAGTGSNQQLLCTAKGQFNTCVWTVDRGLLDTGQDGEGVAHTGQYTVIRLVAGIAINVPQGTTTVGDPLVFPVNPPTVLDTSGMTTISPLFEDLQSSVPVGTALPASATARVTGFGRAPLLPGLTSVGGYTAAIISTTVISNASASFASMLGADLQQDVEPGIASPDDLWQAIMTVTRGPAPQEAFRLYPLNQAVAPSLMSTNVPPRQP